jgi:hypothetical protein
MRALLATLTLIASGVCTVGAGSSSTPLLSFSLTATNGSFTRAIGQGLTLRVERDQIGWEVGVFQKGSSDNLLYPQRNWHGAYPCQLSAWSYRARTFPDQRVIPVRGTGRASRMRLVEAAVSGEPGNEKFKGGRVEIYLEPK